MPPWRKLSIASLFSILIAPQSVLAQNPSGADPNVAAREAFLDALAASDSSPDDAADGELLRGYVLYPYLEAIRLERALAVAVGPLGRLDERAAEMVAVDPETPLAREVRTGWLESLARRGEWPAFLAHYKADDADDELRCESLQARRALGENAELLDAALAAWLTAHRLPPACEPVFEWLAASGHLPPELVEQRVRLLLEAGDASFARVIAARLTDERAAAYRQWARLIEQPEATFDALIDAHSPALDPAIALDAWTRFARSQPDAAKERFRPLERALDLDADARARYALELALGLAWDRQARDALKYFSAAETLDDYALTWQTRAALWRGDWKRALASIGAMSAEQRDTARWRYWAARSSEALGMPAAARALYQSVLGDDNFYSAMAAAHLGRLAVPHLEILPLDTQAMQSVSALPAFVRARELLRAGLRVRAAAEWQYGYASLGEAERRQSVLVAVRWGWYDMAVATATRLGIFNDYELLYPRPYADLIARAAAANDLTTALLYGLIRQESLFRVDAGSAAGAVGLTQLTPATARRVARGSDVEVDDRGDLIDPEVSIALGAKHLRSLVDAFDGQIAVALAGYNAGPAAAARWLPDEPLAADVWIENIPYNETRAYVERVLWHSVVFAWLASGKAQDTASWITTVRPLGTESDSD